MMSQKTKIPVIRSGGACEHFIIIVLCSHFHHGRFRWPDRWNWHSCKSLPDKHLHKSHKIEGGVPSPLDEAAERAASASKEQAKRDKEFQMMLHKQEKEAAEKAAKAAAKVAAPVTPTPRYSGMANSDADRALRLAAVEARMGIVRCVQCNKVINGPGFDQMGHRYCSTACVAVHRQKLPS